MKVKSILRWAFAFLFVGCSSGTDMNSLFNPQPIATEKLVIAEAHVTSHNVRAAMTVGLNTLDVTEHMTSGDVEVVLEDCDDSKTVKIQAQSGGSLVALGAVACSVAKDTGVTVAPTLALMDKIWKIGFYQETDKSDMVTTEDILFVHDALVTDVLVQVTVSTVYSYNAADCKLYDRILPAAEVYIQKTRLFNETHLADMTVSGQFNSASAPVVFASAIPSDGVGPHSDKIRVDILMVTPVVTNYTMTLGAQINGVSAMSRTGMKVLIPSKTFDVSGTKYRRVYGYSHFSHSDGGLAFITGSLLGGESVASGSCEETADFLENTGTNTSDYYTLLTLTDAVAFGVDYNLAIDFQ